ncbi:hypothetical protein KAW18_01130 [candidate division WOR-3 bacterium]|nr:hypothetical protein [candidate division WOR-3 bacterium]
MIPLSGKLKDDLQKKYRNFQNLPIIEQKKPSLAECRTCSQFEEGPDSVGKNVKKINWCVTKYFDKRLRRPVIHYANIELLSQCPKKIDRK